MHVIGGVCRYVGVVRTFPMIWGWNGGKREAVDECDHHTCERNAASTPRVLNERVIQILVMFIVTNLLFSSCRKFI
jgi:hypothetical protein